MHKKIAFLGCGNMGSAIITALLDQLKVQPQNIFIVDKSKQKLEAFQKRGCSVSTNAQESIRGAKYVFLAVKPQNVTEVLLELTASLQKDTVLVSIAAGLSAKFLQQQSEVKRIIRVMPNTPALVQMGVSGMYANENVSDKERGYIQNLLESFGIVIPCETEEKIDAITALSGSGPAYFFRILESMAATAEELGFSPQESQVLALHTMRGAGELALKSNEDFSALRAQVTSKGGTTAQALQVFEEQCLHQVLQAGIGAALRRAHELGREIY